MLRSPTPDSHHKAISSAARVSFLRSASWAFVADDHRDSFLCVDPHHHNHHHVTPPAAVRPLSTDGQIVCKTVTDDDEKAKRSTFWMRGVGQTTICHF
jgi:hypothetical protein